jgi:hypothetical protein
MPAQARLRGRVQLLPRQGESGPGGSGQARLVPRQAVDAVAGHCMG